MLKNGLYVAVGIVLATIFMASMGSVLGQSGTSSDPARYEFHLAVPPNSDVTGVSGGAGDIPYSWGVVLDNQTGTSNTWTFYTRATEHFLQPTVIPFFGE